MGLDFTTIDFETANEQRGSVCAVGITTVRDSRIVDTHSWLVTPPGELRFTNTRIHGITAEHVAGAAGWAESVAQIDEISGGSILVAYNSPFDKGVHTAACTLASVHHPGHVWRDARVLAKTHLEMEKYKLVQVARHLGIPDFAHHDAGADAHACALVTLALAERAGIDTVDALWPITSTAAGSYRSYTRLPKTDEAADPDHPLYGASITFTGDLVTLTRDEARVAAAALGAAVTAGPTKKTDVVVVGGFDPTTLRPGATVSSKLQKAMDLVDAGQRIELISEADLIALLAYEAGR